MTPAFSVKGRACRSPRALSCRLLVCRADSHATASQRHVSVTESRDALTEQQTVRRVLLAGCCVGLLPVAGASPASATSASEASYTSKVYLDVGQCPEMLRAARTIGDKTALCFEPTQLGRLVIGLYGDTAPDTCNNFLKLLNDGVYNGTAFHKIVPGLYVKAGKQGSKRYGEIDPGRVDELGKNLDTVSSRAFSRSHYRPGTVSLCVRDNDDDPSIKNRPGYHSVEFAITTGPAPASSLDGGNVVFGQVLQGMDILSEIAAVPTIKASETMQTYNALASFLGDDRAAKAREKWGKPLQAVVITGSGVL